MNSRSALVIGLLATAFAGCTVDHYRWETIINEDGSATRAIYQPVEQTPPALLKLNKWTTRGYLHEIDREEWDGKIADLKLVPQDADDLPGYFAASGKFVAVEKIPNHYFQGQEIGGRVLSEMKHSLEIRDLVFVKEYNWRETLTDIVQLEDAAVARRELVKTYVSLADDLLSGEFGNEYNFDGLIEWARSDGADLYEELSLAYQQLLLEHRIEPMNGKDKDTEARFLAIAKKYGLNGFEDADFDAFVTLLVSQHVVRRDGGPVDAEKLAARINKLFEAPEQQEGDTPSAWGRLIARRYGSKEAFDDVVQLLMARQFGCHGLFLWSPNEEFDVTIEMPGRVVETNGILIDEHRVRWSFKGTRIAPSGLSMTCRSLLPDPQMQTKILGRISIDTPESMQQLADFVANDKELLVALQACRETDSLRPLIRHRELLGPEEKVPSVNRREEQMQRVRARKILEFLARDPSAQSRARLGWGVVGVSLLLAFFGTVTWVRHARYPEGQTASGRENATASRR